MSNMLLRLLRDAGIVQGQVLTFRRSKTARSAAANMEGRSVVNVPESPICGVYWLMERADAQRMAQQKGYQIEFDPGPADQPPSPPLAM